MSDSLRKGGSDFFFLGGGGAGDVTAIIIRHRPEKARPAGQQLTMTLKVKGSRLIKLNQLVLGMES